MRKIIFISLFAIVSFAACKKQLVETKTAETLENQTNAGGGGVICTGNTWAAAGYYKGNSNLPLIYNNKAYVFDQPSHNLFIFDGTSWDSVSKSTPFIHHPGFAFTIGDKGYLGYKPLGPFGGSSYFWQYDFTAKTWSSKPGYPGNGKTGCATFTIGNKAYVAGGQYTIGGWTISAKDMWEYNQATNSWTKKADIPSVGIHNGAGFSIGNKGYLLNGTSNSGAQLAVLYEYNPATNTWNTKTPFPGQPQDRTHVFVIGGAAYAGGGYRQLVNLAVPAYYKYSPATNAWVSIASVPFYGIIPRVSFAINSKGFVMDVIPDGMEPSTGYAMYKYTPAYCYTLGSSQ
jgi:N-acetylneuraminic acid mutarotase